VKGDYYAVGEIVSLLLQITTDDTFSQPSSAQFFMELVLIQGETITSVENNCYACNKSECSANGALVVPNIFWYQVFDKGLLWLLQFSGLTKNTRTVIRIDMVMGASLDCGCHCDYNPGAQSTCYCPAVVTPRSTHLSGGKRSTHLTRGKRSTHLTRVQRSTHLSGGKRNDQSAPYYNPNRDPTRELGIDEYTVPLFIDDYYLNDVHYTFPVKYLVFGTDALGSSTLCDVVSCVDNTGCFTGAPSGKINGSYKDRTCVWVEVSCDDGDPNTWDRCVPLNNPDPQTTPNCVHTPMGVSLNGFCYYFDGDGYNCKEPCFSDRDCETAGICYQTNCANALQQENLELATDRKRQSVGSLSALQLGGIIGGCVCFVVVAVVVIYKLSQAKQEMSINEDTFASLQVPLN